MQKIKAENIQNYNKTKKKKKCKLKCIQGKHEKKIKRKRIKS